MDKRSAQSWFGFSNLILAVIGLSVAPFAEVAAQISVTKIAEYQMGSNAQPLNAVQALNLRSHVDDGIVSFNGYQYAVYWSVIGTDLTKRYVTIGRRHLPAGAWETVQLTDYVQTINDSHRVVSMGICEGDGTIHMAFDHHNNNIHYRISVQGLATDPESHSWVASKFNAEQEFLPGLTWEDTKGCTYPRFTHKPNGDLQLIRRKGSAINGQSFIYTYSPNTQLWVKHGIYINGSAKWYHNDAGVNTKLNAYLHGVNYDENDRLHVSWVWRTEDGKNFDLMYAYSDNSGITWYNNADQLAGSTSNPMTLSNSPPVKVRTYAEGILYNQTGQTVDSQGRVHVVQRKNGKFMHLYRNMAGQWIENTTTLPVGRYKLTVDQHDNLYYITSGTRVYAATPANNYTDWTNVYNGELSRFGGDPSFDESRMKHEGILSILVETKAAGSKEIYSVDLSVSPVIPSPPIPQDINVQEWNVATAWNPDGIPSSGNDYTSDLSLFSPISTSTFGGDTLTMLTNGVLHIKNINGRIATVPDLIMNGGTIVASRGVNTTNILSGKLSIQSDTTIRDNLTNGVRDIRLEAQIAGSATIISTAIAVDSGHELRVINPSNNFSGDWISRRGTLVFEDPSAIGAGNIIVEDRGGLTILGDWNQPDAQLTVADSSFAHVDLGSNDWTLSLLTLGTNDLADGTYTVAALNGMGDAVFSGSGSITVGTDVIWQDTTLQAWNISSTWNPDGVAVAGFDYATDLRLRTLTTSATFPGDSLTVYPPGGQLQMRHTGLAIVTTVPNLILAGGRVIAGTGNNVVSVLDGNIAVAQDSQMSGYWSGTVYRSLRILSSIDGSANLTNTTSQAGSIHELQIVNPANTFSGTWVGHTGTMVFENAGAVGTADIVLLNEGKLTIEGNWNQATNGASLTVADSANAAVNIGTYQWEVAALQIGSNALGDGIYDVDDLNAEGQAVFTGTGSINVNASAIQPPILAFDLDASNGLFSFSWSNGSYILQMLTNDLVSDLWFDYPNGTTSPVNHTLDPDDGPAGFFRLIQP